jgi:hypothetical protein
MKHKIIFAIAVMSLAATACDSTQPGGSGTLKAVLVSPNGAEGAAVLDVTGTVESVTAPGDVTVFTTPSANGTRVIVMRLTPGELSMNIAVPNVSTRPVVTVVEVADGDDKIRPSLTGYQVTFR